MNDTDLPQNEGTGWPGRDLRHGWQSPDPSTETVQLTLRIGLLVGGGDRPREAVRAATDEVTGMGVGTARGRAETTVGDVDVHMGGLEGGST